MSAKHADKWLPQQRTFQDRRRLRKKNSKDTETIFMKTKKSMILFI